jgi:hypothetical protein
MGSLMDIEMRLLIETLGAILDCTLIPLLATLRARFFLNILLRELVLTRVSRTIRSGLRRSLHVRRGTGDTYHRSTLVCR